MISGIRVILGTWLTFEGYFDLISASWNVEDDILLRRGVCDARKKKKRERFLWTVFSAQSGRISSQFLAGYLAGLVGSFEKKLRSLCLESGRLFGWISGQILAGFCRGQLFLAIKSSFFDYIWGSKTLFSSFPTDRTSWGVKGKRETPFFSLIHSPKLEGFLPISIIYSD